MQFLRNLFGGSGGKATSREDGDSAGFYFYIKPHVGEEIVRLRINRANDLSLSDDGNTYWVRKIVRGRTWRQNVEVELYFDKNRNLSNSEVMGGKLVTREEYDTWIASRETAS